MCVTGSVAMLRGPSNASASHTSLAPRLLAESIRPQISRPRLLGTWLQLRIAQSQQSGSSRSVTLSNTFTLGQRTQAPQHLQAVPRRMGGSPEATMLNHLAKGDTDFSCSAMAERYQHAVEAFAQ